MSEPTVLVVRNEVDEAYAYHPDALASHFPDRRECDAPAGERPDLEGIDAVVLTGSTAGVYEVDEEPWIDDQLALVRELVERRVPTLGVCFGHQLANAALGGRVEHVGTTSRYVAADLADDPLFEGVEPVVPAVHGDVVREPGAEMDVIASADYYSAFATRHRTAPLWTVQFHPEFTADVLEAIERDFGWTETEYGPADVTATRVCSNFRSLAREVSRPK
jgi:GMP synthase (glutamine-hydrolysing)